MYANMKTFLFIVYFSFSFLFFVFFFCFFVFFFTGRPVRPRPIRPKLPVRPSGQGKTGTEPADFGSKLSFEF